MPDDPSTFTVTSPPEMRHARNPSTELPHATQQVIGSIAVVPVVTAVIDFDSEAAKRGALNDSIDRGSVRQDCGVLRACEGQIARLGSFLQQALLKKCMHRRR